MFSILDLFRKQKKNLFVDFVKSEGRDFFAKDFKSEFLDLVDKQRGDMKVFSIYDSFYRNGDVSFFLKNKLKSSLIEVNCGRIGREFFKSSKFRVVDSKYSGVKCICEVISGEGYILLENTSDRFEVILVKISENSKVFVDENFAFTIINSSLSSPLCVNFIMRSKSIFLDIGVEKYGALLFLVESGFVLNKNYKPNYKLEEVSGDYLLDFNFASSDKELYFQFLEFEEKFKFLKE